MPRYIVKGRSSYHLQRLVPKDCREVLGRSKWTAPGGTLNQARTKVPAFLARTDREIREARGERLSAEEQLIHYGPTDELSIFEMVEAVAPRGLSAYDDSGNPDPEFSRLYEIASKVQKGEARELLTSERLLQARYHEREPAARTYESWKQSLNGFMAFTGKARPGLCTKTDAVAYSDHLLTFMGRNSAKTRIAFLSGLWTTLVAREDGDHIFKGLAGKLSPTTREQAQKASLAKRNQSFEPTTPIEDWSGSQYVDIFKILYYTGCRLAEVVGLTGEDLHEDFISVAWSDERSLKTSHSVRDIPLHPQLKELIKSLSGRIGPIWPNQKSVKTIDGVEIIRWGHNLSKPCRKVTGLKPKDFRDRFATQLRGHNFNQVNIERLMGHSAVDTNSSYGGKNWEAYVSMVNQIS